VINFSNFTHYTNGTLRQGVGELQIAHPVL